MEDTGGGGAGAPGMCVAVQSSPADEDYQPHSTGGSGNELLSITFWSSHTGLTHTKEPLKKPERFTKMAGVVSSE